MVWHSGVITYQLPSTFWGRHRQQTGFQSNGEWDWYPSDPYQCDYLHFLDWFGSSKVQETDFESWFDVNCLCSATCLCTPQRFIAIAQHVVKWCEMYCICDWEARVEVQKSKNLFGRKSAGADLPQESRLSSHNFEWFWPIRISSYLLIWMFPKIMGTPKSSILIGFSIINHRFWGTAIFGNTHLFITQITYIVEVQNVQSFRLRRAIFLAMQR